jgi:uncharacterized repeat protein (TIGR03803 family)
MLYGTTSTGGTGDQCTADGGGTVYAVDRKTGTETVLHSFGNGTDGCYPNPGLLKVNGMLYGTTSNGGGPCRFGRQPSCGTVFAIDPESGAETVLYNFCRKSHCRDGANPGSGLIEMNGKLYGSTGLGGSTRCHGGCGTVFMLDPRTGKERVIYAFLAGGDGRGTAFLVNVGGMFYGATIEGGTSKVCGRAGCGSLFQLDPATGEESVLYSFTGHSDGSFPDFAPISMNGALYGGTFFGPNDDGGTLFAFNLTTGAETTLYDFPAGGGYPSAPLVEMNGTLYGTAAPGGVHQEGTVFALDPATGAVTTVYSFLQTKKKDDGINPAGLVAAHNVLYGVTAAGGADDSGTVFSLRP